VKNGFNRIFLYTDFINETLILVFLQICQENSWANIHWMWQEGMPKLIIYMKCINTNTNEPWKKVWGWLKFWIGIYSIVEPLRGQSLTLLVGHPDVHGVSCWHILRFSVGRKSEMSYNKILIKKWSMSDSSYWDLIVRNR
jgi:hypothetical protein